MNSQSITQFLTELRTAADGILSAWPVTYWKKVAGPGPEILELDSNGVLKNLTFEPGQKLILECDLDLPSHLSGIPIRGDSLVATQMSIYPARLEWLDQSFFVESDLSVAAGPALVSVIPSLNEGNNGTLRLTIDVPSTQTSTFFNLRFTTHRLRSYFELLDILWAELKLAYELATAGEYSTIQKALALIPENFIEIDEEILHAIEQKLSIFSARISQHHVHIIGHSHIDMNWLWNWPDTVNVILRDFRNILHLMEEYPELTFTHSQPATYEVVRECEPELFKKVVQYIQAGRWEPATMTWVEADSNMTSGEALARHLTESVWYSREYLLVNPTTFLAPDTFGHAGNLPQAIASAGGVRYYHHRCNPGQTDPWPAYWWEGQDGSRILAISTPTYNGEIRARDLAEVVLQARKYGQYESLHFHGVGDHGGGPSRQNLEALRRFQARPLLPKAFCSTLQNYTTALLNSGVRLPVWHGESSTIFEGCYTTHGDIKRLNRMGENLLCTADTLASLAGLDCQEKMQDAWRTVLFNQFHDILDGSAIHDTYIKAAEDIHQAVETAQSVIAEACERLEAGFPFGSIAVTNPCGWERTDWVNVEGIRGEGNVILSDEMGNTIVGQFTNKGLGFAARIPAFGISAYRIMKMTTPDNQLSITPAFAPNDSRQAVFLAEKLEEPPYYKIETPHFLTHIRRDSGILVSFFDKRVGRELIGYGLRRASDYLDTARADLAFNVFQLAEEHPHGMSAWHLDEVHTEHSLLQGAKTRIIETGNARIVLEVEHTLRKSQIIEHIIFYRDIARVDFETHLDWNEPGSPEVGIPNLKIAFTARLTDCEAWFETPFAAVRRPADGQEVPALRWADVGGQDYGISLLNDSKYGYDILGCRLRMNLVRSGYDPDSHSDIGKHVIRFSLVPHPGNWRQAGIVKMAAGFNQPLLARQVRKQTRHRQKTTWRPILSDNTSVVISCMKIHRHKKGRIIRLYESSGISTSVDISGFPSNVQIWETNIIEESLHQLSLRDGHIHLSFSPWQIKTLLIIDEK